MPGGSPWRIQLLQGSATTVLIFTFNHVIGDGCSGITALRDFLSLLSHEDGIPPLLATEDGLDIVELPPTPELRTVLSSSWIKSIICGVLAFVSRFSSPPLSQFLHSLWSQFLHSFWSKKLTSGCRHRLWRVYLPPIVPCLTDLAPSFDFFTRLLDPAWSFLPHLQTPGRVCAGPVPANFECSTMIRYVPAKSQDTVLAPQCQHEWDDRLDGWRERWIDGCGGDVPCGESNFSTCRWGSSEGTSRLLAACKRNKSTVGGFIAAATGFLGGSLRPLAPGLLNNQTKAGSYPVK